MHRDEKGFTLIELIVVMAILAVLAALAVPRFTGMLEQSKLKAHNANVEMIAKAAEVYWAEKGAALASLAALETAGYIDDTNLADVPYSHADPAIPYTCTITVAAGVGTLTITPGKSTPDANGKYQTPAANLTKTLN